MKKNRFLVLLTATMLTMSSQAGAHDSIMFFANDDVTQVQSEGQQDVTTETQNAIADATNTATSQKKNVAVQKRGSMIKANKVSTNDSKPKNNDINDAGDSDTICSDSVVNAQDNQNDIDMDDWRNQCNNEAFSFSERILSNQFFWKVIITLTVISMIFILALVFIIGRLIGKRHNSDRNNQHIEMRQNISVEAGTAQHTYSDSDIKEKDEQWKRGVKHICLGFGFSLLVCILGANELSGIGLLIVCLGIGQVIISRRYSIEDYKNLFRSKTHTHDNNAGEAHTANTTGNTTVNDTYTNHETSKDNNTETADATAPETVDTNVNATAESEEEDKEDSEEDKEAAEQ